MGDPPYLAIIIQLEEKPALVWGGATDEETVRLADWLIRSESLEFVEETVRELRDQLAGLA